MIITDKIALQRTKDTLEAHPCFGHQKGLLTLLKEECWSCLLLSRCRDFSRCLNYSELFTCECCGLTTPDLHRITQVFLDGNVQAFTKCPECKNTGLPAVFVGEEQKVKLCKNFDEFFEANCNRQGTHDDPYVVPKSCVGCKRKFPHCLATVKAVR